RSDSRWNSDLYERWNAVGCRCYACDKSADGAAQFEHSACCVGLRQGQAWCSLQVQAPGLWLLLWRVLVRTVMVECRSRGSGCCGWRIQSSPLWSALQV